MFSLGPFVASQDENAGLAASKARFGLNKENAPVGLSVSGKAAAPGNQRRAFGNITNIGNGSIKQQLGSEKPGSGKGLTGASVQGPGHRRALGDITNSARQIPQITNIKPAAAPVIVKPSNVPVAQPQPIPAARTAPSKHDALASQWAAEGVERPAGKNWSQLESERQIKIEQSINARVQAAMSAVSNWKPALSISPDAQDSTLLELLSNSEDERQLAELNQRVMRAPFNAFQGTAPRRNVTSDLLLPDKDIMDLLPDLNLDDDSWSELL